MKKKLTSKDLQLIQDALKSNVNERLSDQMVDYEEAIKIIKVLSKVDHIRRLAWNKEKFGAYETFADEVLKLHGTNHDLDFNADDIPF